MYKVRTGFLNDSLFDTLEQAVNCVYYPNGEKRFPSFEHRIWYADSHQLVEQYLIDQEIGNLRRRMYEKQIYWAKKRYGPYKFRQGPVAHTGKRGRYCWLRNPKTKQEITYGSRRDLPTSWDDIPRHVEKNWKKYRKTQWKEKSYD